MSSCLLPTIQLLQPTLEPIHNHSPAPTSTSPLKPKQYPPPSSSFKLSRMRAALLRAAALVSLLGASNAQSTWAQTQAFHVDVSTDALLGSSQQGLTNAVGSNTPVTLTAVSVTDMFSASLPTELGSSSSVGLVGSSAVGSVGSSIGSSVASASAPTSAAASSTPRSASSTAPLPQSTNAAALVDVNGQTKLLGVVGVLAGAAGVLFA